MIYQKRENQKFRIINRNNTTHKRNNAAEINICRFYYCTFNYLVSSSAFVIITKTEDEIKYLYDTDPPRIEKNWQMKY
jgi:hypothetical protein